MNIFRFKFCSLLLLIQMLVIASYGQMVERDALAIPVVLKARYYANYWEELNEDGWPDNSGYGSIGLQLGLRIDAETATSEGYTTFEPSTYYLKPGAVNELMVDLQDQSSLDYIQLSAPAGYRIFIDDIQRSRINGMTAIQEMFSIRIERTETLPFGECASLRPGRLSWMVGLGTMANNTSAGVIRIAKEKGGSDGYYGAKLVYDSANPEADVIYQNGSLRQILVANGLVNITYGYNGAFYLYFFPLSEVAGKSNGLYTFTGNTSCFYTFIRDYSSVSIYKYIGSGSPYRTMSTYLDMGSYRVIDWDGSEHNLDTNGITTTSAGGVTAYVEKRTYISQELTLLERGDDNMESPQIRQYFHYNSNNSQLLSTVGGDQSTTSYCFFEDGSSAGRNFGGIDGSYNYEWIAAMTAMTTDWNGTKTLPTRIEGGSGEGLSRSDYTYSYSTLNDTSRTYSGSNATMPIKVTTRKDYFLKDSTHFTTTIRKTFREDSDPQYGYFPGQFHSEKRPDGTMDVCLYFRGAMVKDSNSADRRRFAVAKDGPEVMRLTIHGTSIVNSASVGLTSFTLGAPLATTTGDHTQTTEPDFRIVPGVSTASAVVTGTDGMISCKAALICAGTPSSYSWVITERDIYSYAHTLFLTSITRDAGVAADAWPMLTNSWVKGRIDYTIDETGVRTDYTYIGSTDRVLTKTRTAATALGATINARTTTYEYDAVGHIVKETVTGTGLTESLITSRTYDTAGRLLTETVPGYATMGTVAPATTSYDYDGVNYHKHTLTLPSGATQVVETYANGLLKSKTGTGLIHEHYTYTAEADGRMKTTRYLGSFGDARKRETWVDMMGREVKSVLPGFSGTSQPSIEVNSFYEDLLASAYTGRKSKVTKSGLAPSIFEYIPSLNTIRSGTDIDATAGLQPSSASDRLTDATASYEYIDGAWWATTQTLGYPFAGSATAIVMSKTRKRLTGLSATLRSETRTEDAEGNEKRVTVAVDVATRVVTTTTKRAGISVEAVEKSLNGLPIESTGHDGITLKKRYDAFGRLIGEIDPRTGSDSNYSAKHFYHLNTTWPKEVKDALNNRIVLRHYDAAGRVIYIENAIGKTTRTSYTPRNEPAYIWGTATYPVSYTYNAYGERITMRTYRDASGIALTDTSTFPSLGTYDQTIWDYDAPSGLLKKKTDAANKFVEYTYNTRGQTYQRFWARPVPGSNPSVRVTTTYSYDGGTGEHTGLTYNDGTPGVTYAYTRLGQVGTVQDASSSGPTDLRDFSYDPSYPWRLVGETLNDFYGDRAISRLYENSGMLGRPRGFKLGGAVGSNSELEQTYGYSATSGRFESLVSSRGSNTVSRTFRYGYEADSALVKTLWTDDNDFFVTRSFEDNRDLLESVDTKWGQSASSSIAKYVYASNQLSQRESVEQSGDAFTGYGGTANTIHQSFTYNDRSELKTAPTNLGTVASPGAAVSNRQHEFDYDAIGNRKWAGLTGNSGDRKNYTSNALNQYSARDNTLAPFTGTQGFTYDDDGNVLTDGLWIYLWDAENRLVRMTSSLPVGQGHTRLELNFKYDYLGRRVEKKVENIDGPTPTFTHRYLYDGWSLIAEYDVSGGTLILKRSYTWGLDIARTLSDAGGVGALVQIVDHSANQSYHPAYDGNGNIAALVNGGTGAIAAVYEYSPYGELIRDENPDTTLASRPQAFRFSTKFTDDETGLVYYGRRYYSPSQGRFLGRDPKMEKGGLNLYGFVRNNSINFWDYLGMSPGLGYGTWGHGNYGWGYYNDPSDMYAPTSFGPEDVNPHGWSNYGPSSTPSGGGIGQITSGPASVVLNTPDPLPVVDPVLLVGHASGNGFSQSTPGSCVATALRQMIFGVTGTDPGDLAMLSAVANATATSIGEIVTEDKLSAAVVQTITEHGLTATANTYTNTTSMALGLSGVPSLVIVRTDGGTFHAVTMTLSGAGTTVTITNPSGQQDIGGSIDVPISRLSSSISTLNFNSPMGTPPMPTSLSIDLSFPVFSVTPPPPPSPNPNL